MRVSSSPESATSSLKLSCVPRRGALPAADGSAAQLPVAESTASGTRRLSLDRRHSRWVSRPAGLRLTASTSSRPSFLPRSSSSSMTMSSAGMLLGWLSSKASTSCAAAAPRLRRDSLA